MRCMRKNHREDERKAAHSFCESNNLFNGLVKKILDSKNTPQPMRFKKVVETDKVVQKHSEAANKTIKASSSAWMKKRGSVEDNRYTNINRVIFEMLDPEDRGEVPGNLFIRFLLEIGLSLNPQKIKDVLCAALRKDHNNFKVKYDDICSLCKGDHRIKMTTKCINHQVKEARLNRSEGLSVDHSIITTVEQIGALNDWWIFLDKQLRNQVAVNIVAEFLAVKSIAGDSHEGRKQVKEVAGEYHYIDKDQFFTIFGRALIRWALINIQSKFSEEDWKNPDYSPSLKMTCLNRNLIMAGLKCPRAGVSQDEGALVISAIEKYRKFSNDNIPRLSFHDFVKSWEQTLNTYSEEKKPRNKLKISSIEAIMNGPRPGSVPTMRLESENIFYGEFQKFVNS